MSALGSQVEGGHHPSYPGRWLVLAALLLGGLAGFLVTGCDSGSPPEATSTASAEILPQSGPGPTAAPTEPTPVSAEVTPTVTSVTTLTLWTTDALSPTQVLTSGQVLSAERAKYEAATPGVRVEFVLKKPYGKGGILDFLLTTKTVVPNLLPDLVMMDVDEIGAAVQAGLLQPLESLLPPDLVADLYPFARESCTFDGHLYGLQFQADLDHLAYDTRTLPVPPASWPGVLSSPGPYLFPAGGKAGLVNDAFLIQYLALQTQPAAPDSDRPFPEVESLTAVLQFYRDGLSQGVFPATSLKYHTTDECWQDYLEGEASMALVSAHRYLADTRAGPDREEPRPGRTMDTQSAAGQKLQNSGAAAIPAIGGPATSISRGWALAVVTPDSARQSLAAAYIAQWLQPETNATWNHAVSYLPTRQSALATWDPADSYTGLARQLLQTAHPRPALANYSQVAEALQKAVEQVLSGAMPPEQAADQAVEAVRP